MANASVTKGDFFTTNEGYLVEIIDYRSATDVIVVFDDKYDHRQSVSVRSLKNGSIKNPYHPSVCGVGCYGVGKFLSKVNKVRTAEYEVWTGIIKRCYSASHQEKNPWYVGCTVSDDWLNFQNFAEWYTSHKYYGLGYEIDKDLLIKGNKVYSSDTCVIIPHDINTILLDRSADRGGYMLGVTRSRRNGRFVSRLSVNGKRKHLGIFDTEQEAHQAYVVAKEAHVKEKAIEYKKSLSSEVFDILMNWRVGSC